MYTPEDTYKRLTRITWVEAQVVLEDLYGKYEYMLNLDEELDASNILIGEEFLERTGWELSNFLQNEP